MIIHHQTNVGGMAGQHVWYWPTQPFISRRISGTSVTAGFDNIVNGTVKLVRFLAGTGTVVRSTAGTASIVRVTGGTVKI